MKFLRLDYFLVFLLGVLPVLYGAGYVWARLTHRLVWYGSFVARPHAMSGIGYSDWELLFLPPSWIEAQVRNNLP
jgi:hypothetical protein